MRINICRAIYTMMIGVLLLDGVLASDNRALNVDKQSLMDKLTAIKLTLADSPTDIQQLKQAGMINHQLARLGVDKAAADAVMFLEQVIHIDANDNEALAYLGSAMTVQAKLSSSPMAKLSQVNRGLAFLDKAVKRDADNLRLRWLRASVCYALPKMFERQPMAAADYRFIIHEQRAAQQFTPQRLAEIYYKLGKLSLEQGENTEATGYFLQAQQIMPDSVWAKRAKKAQP